MPSMLCGDEVRIKQVLTNMISNAIKYTQKGTVTLRAKSEQLDGNRILLRLAVSDTGIGIRKEDTAYLFISPVSYFLWTISILPDSIFERSRISLINDSSSLPAC
mgnify:CR=1 FL=1